jgi:hypothetical protein
MLSNAFGLSQEYNMTDTEYNKAMAHHTAQSMREHCFPVSLLCLTCTYIPEGLHGHQFEENIHPRRVFFLETVKYVPLFCFPGIPQLTPLTPQHHPPHPRNAPPDPLLVHPHIHRRYKHLRHVPLRRRRVAQLRRARPAERPRQEL